MSHDVDLVVRNGLVVDGSGAEPFKADVAVSAGCIVEVGRVSARGREEINAKGLFVTPGFVDIHTHYDGQATWENRLVPSSSHGVTTIVMGNCGVGFAPCRPDQHDLLIRLMEGVEDIPHPVLADGVPWTWESYPEYLRFLASRQYDMDVCSYLTSCAPNPGEYHAQVVQPVLLSLAQAPRHVGLGADHGAAGSGRRPPHQSASPI
jgi:N-acyl-D-aspartate/D-glutamate deacylase